jgi:hypothetical protein
LGVKVFAEGLNSGHPIQLFVHASSEQGHRMNVLAGRGASKIMNASFASGPRLKSRRKDNRGQARP